MNEILFSESNENKAKENWNKIKKKEISLQIV